MVNKYIEEIKVYLKRSNPEDKDDVKWYYIVPSVSLAIVILIVIVLIAKRYICKYLPFRISIVLSSIITARTKCYVIIGILFVWWDITDFPGEWTYKYKWCHSGLIPIR